MSFQIGNSLNLCFKQLKAGDYTVKTFEANKLWEFRTNETEYYFYKNFGINTYRALYPENYKYFGNVITISSSMYERTFTTQSLDPKILWYYLDHNYYTDYRKDKLPLITTDDEIITYLSNSASLMTIPVNVFGEGIKKKSVKLYNYSATGSDKYTLIDDGLGNLRDTAFDETKFCDNNNLFLYVGFNEKYREYEVKNKKLPYVLDSSPLHNDVNVYELKKISYEPGINISGSATKTGVCAFMSGSYFKVENKDKFNFAKDRDFAFSFWFKLPTQQILQNKPYNHIFCKNSVKTVYSVNRITGNEGTVSEPLYYDGNSPKGNSPLPSPSSKTFNSPSTASGLIHGYVDVEALTQNYPFEIYLNNNTSANNNTITFKQSGFGRIAEVTSNVLTQNVWHHAVCQKTGSRYQIWIDGVLDDETDVYTPIDDIKNDHNFYIAGNGLTGTGSTAFTGHLDEIRIYGNAIPADKITYLYDNSYDTGYAYQTSRVGNVFYGHGMFVVSDPRPKYTNAFLGSTGNFDYAGLSNGFEGYFRSTTTLYQYEIICKIRKHEFNFTQNSSVRADKYSQNDQLENYVTSSFFNPYITTIGLYNEDRDLVAIAKLANPLEKRDDVDMNVIVRFDM